MKQITRQFTAVILGVLVLSMTAFGVALVAPQTQVEDASPVGESEAVVPAVVGAVAVGAMAIATYDYVRKNYFQGSSKVEQATDETLRQAVHDEAIISEGTNTGFLDNVDNDINTIEGSLEQKLGQAFIRKGDTIKSKSEAVSLAETTASDYLWTTQKNLVETHNYHALSVKTYMAKLDSINQSSDYGATRIVTVDSASDLTSLDADSSQSGTQLPADLGVIKFKSDVTISKVVEKTDSDGLLVEGNGHTVTFAGLTISGTTEWHNITVKGGSAQADVLGGTANLYNTDWNYSLKINKVYLDSSSQAVYNSSYPPTKLNSPATVDYVTSSDYTMTPSDLSTSVPTVTVGSSNVKLTAVKVNVDASYSQNSSNTVKIAVPYDVSSGSPITSGNKDFIIKTSTSGLQNYAVPVDFQRANNLIVQRDNLSSQAYSIASQWAKDMWNNSLKSIASDPNKSITDVKGVYDKLGTYTVSANPNNPATVLSLYTGTYETVQNVADTRMTISSGGQTYKNVVLFSTDMQYLANQTSDTTVIAEGDTFDVSQTTKSNSESFTSVAQGDIIQLSKTNISSITSATNASGTSVSSNVSIVDAEAGQIKYTGSSTIDLSVIYDYKKGPSRTFVVDPSTGKITELSGSVTVDSIKVGNDTKVDTQKIRTFDMTKTNLTNVAKRLDSQYQATIETANRGGGFSLGDIGGTTGIVLIVAIGGALVLLGRS